MTPPLTIINDDVLKGLAQLETGSVQCCVTSPPYWGLRDYGVAGQIGLEKTPELYVENMVKVFEEVRRVLRDDATLWLNLGDSYAGSWGNYGGKNRGAGKQRHIVSGSRVDNSAWDERTEFRPPGSFTKNTGLKPKDLVGIPWMVAFALRSAGWYLRQDIVWAKPNPMPESVTDRCTKSHEYIFLMSKSEKYFYDQEAISEAVSEGTHKRFFEQEDRIRTQSGSARVPGKTNGPMKAVVKKSGNKERKPAGARGVPVDTDGSTNGAVAGSVPWEGCTRNKRSVWTITTKPYSDAHFAVFPEELPKICILAGTPPGQTVLDPFAGSGTTGQVALELGRKAVLIELNPAYVELIKKRCNVTMGLGI